MTLKWNGLRNWWWCKLIFKFHLFNLLSTIHWCKWSRINGHCPLSNMKNSMYNTICYCPVRDNAKGIETDSALFFIWELQIHSHGHRPCTEFPINHCNSVADRVDALVLRVDQIHGLVVDCLHLARGPSEESPLADDVAFHLGSESLNASIIGKSIHTPAPSRVISCP